MPKLDKTGPQGQGPGTGWGMGPCGMGSFCLPPFRCMGSNKRKRGLGKYFCCNWELSKSEKTKALKEYKKALVEELEDIEKELSKAQ